MPKLIPQRKDVAVIRWCTVADLKFNKEKEKILQIYKKDWAGLLYQLIEKKIYTFKDKYQEILLCKRSLCNFTSELNFEEVFFGTGLFIS